MPKNPNDGKNYLPNVVSHVNQIEVTNTFHIYLGIHYYPQVRTYDLHKNQHKQEAQTRLNQPIPRSLLYTIAISAFTRAAQTPRLDNLHILPIYNAFGHMIILKLS